MSKLKTDNKEANMANVLVSKLGSLADSKKSSSWIKSYNGADAVFKCYEEFLDKMKNDDEICNYVSPAPVAMAGYRKGMRKFIDSRMQRQIFSKTICTVGEDAIRLKLTDDYSLRKTLISFENAPDEFYSEILLCKTHILGASYTSDFAFSYLMLDKDIAAMHLAVFNLAWKQALREDSHILQDEKIQKMMDALRGIRKY